MLLFCIAFFVWCVVVLTRGGLRQRSGRDAGTTVGAAAEQTRPGDVTVDAREDLDQVVWRFRQLVRLGVDPVTALGASLAGVDCAAVRSLVERGCPAALALSILEPEEDSVRGVPSA
jgi:hypothetical protein